MGLRYLGPIDGHDLPMLLNCLEFAKSVRRSGQWSILNRRRAPPHLELLGPAGGPRFHQQIAHTQFFDKTQRFLARARSDRQHADHRAYAEDHAKPGQRRADFLRQEIFRGQRQV